MVSVLRSWGWWGGEGRADRSRGLRDRSSLPQPSRTLCTPRGPTAPLCSTGPALCPEVLPSPSSSCSPCQPPTFMVDSGVHLCVPVRPGKWRHPVGSTGVGGTTPCPDSLLHLAPASRQMGLQEIGRGPPSTKNIC